VLQLPGSIEGLDPGSKVVVCQSRLHAPELRKGLITILSGVPVVPVQAFGAVEIENIRKDGMLVKKTADLSITLRSSHGAAAHPS
jgi:hypothetical protein